MPSTVNKFINASTFVTATAVYDDADLTIISPDGYYQYNSEYRYQLNGLLGPLVVCESCDDPAPNPIACGSGIVIPQSSAGLYELNFSAGSTTGAISILFQPQDVPDGIRVLYNGVYYNRLSTPLDGNRQSTSGVADAFTVLGLPAAQGPCSVAPQTYTLNYYNGLNQSPASWIPGTPTTKTITTNTGDDVLGGANPQYNLLIIPKTSATPSNVKIEVLGTCPTTQFNLEVACPANLPSFQGKSIASGTGCTTANATYYFGRFRYQVNTYPELNNPIFNDVNGEFRVLDGNYYMDNSQVITVTNGVVSSIVACS
jgi:hypothetical protein